MYLTTEEGLAVSKERKSGTQPPASCRGYVLPKGMTPDCFRDLTRLFARFERDELGLAEDAAIEAFRIVSRQMA